MDTTRKSFKHGTETAEVPMDWLRLHIAIVVPKDFCSIAKAEIVFTDDTIADLAVERSL